MWYPPVVTVAATTDPVPLDLAVAHTRIEPNDTEEALLEFYLKAATAHVEEYVSTPLSRRTVQIAADGFCDLARLPIAPVASITSITYDDTAGVQQTLAPSVYRLFSYDLQASVELQSGQQWPGSKPGERITLTTLVGYDKCPYDVTAAILLMTAHMFNNREAVGANTAAEMPMGVAALLCNHRRCS